MNGSFFADVSYYESKLNIGEDIKSILMLPVAAVAIVPMMIIWGAACAGSTTTGC